MTARISGRIMWLCVRRSTGEVDTWLRPTRKLARGRSVYLNTITHDRGWTVRRAVIQ